MSCNVLNTQHCALFNNTPPLSPALAIAPYMTSPTPSFLAPVVERRAYIYMEPIVAEGCPDELYNQFSLVHVDIMHRVTESFDSRMDGCWS